MSVSKLTMKETAARPDGIFYELSADGVRLCDVLSHAYDDGVGGYAAKTRPGTYVMRRGMHQLQKHDGTLTPPFETFEVTGVEGHSGILFHTGNKNADSNGCNLPGTMFKVGDEWQVIKSLIAFNYLMSQLRGQDEVPLDIE